MQTFALKNPKSEYFRNLKDLKDNKNFWKKNKSFYSGKGLETYDIILKGKSELINDSSLLDNLLNNYFINIEY